MKKERKENSFIKKPIYPGGQKAMKAFIRENLKYPEEAVKNQIQGTVTLRYTINHLGKVIKANVISGLGYGCDEEAIRLVMLLQFQVEKVRKLRVTFKKEIHIHFRKPTIKKKQQVIQYQYKSKKDESTEAPEGQNQPQKGYNYIIRY